MPERMLLSKEQSAINLVNAWRAGAVRVGKTWLEGHLIISAETIIRDWRVDTPEQLALADLDAVVAMQPEIVLLGTGTRLVLPAASITQALADRSIGIEVMDTPAACRTYNVLAHEGRHVVAALFMTGS